MKRKLIVTGAHGFVAGSVLRAAQASNDWEVHALSRHPGPIADCQRHWWALDPVDRKQLDKVFREIQPQAVIHTAAVADIDFCQQHQDVGRAVNISLTQHLAELSAETGARLVFCSTDTVFDGEKPPYGETDAPGPVNFYAETKVAAEEIVRALGQQGVTARLALVVGLPVFGAGNSFLVRVLASFRTGRPVGMSPSEIRTPVDVLTAGRALLELAAGTEHGIFHLAGLSSVSRVNLARAIAERFGFSTDLVTTQAPADLAGRTPRPRDVSLSCRRTQAQLQTPMRTLDAELSLILEAAATSTL
jgi:dTDP-4-dehydrorhamnose reductase